MPEPYPNQPANSIIAALTLARYPLRSIYCALVRMGLDRPRLRHTPGLRFWKLLGCARGPALGPWDARRYALFTVWESSAALDAFEARSPIMATYRGAAEEIWTVRLAPLRWQGTWGGADPFAGAPAARGSYAGPLAILTRATIRLRHLAAFTRAAGPVTTRLPGRPGLIASIGLGEAPLMFQATFSLWVDLPEVQRFAYHEDEHAEVVRRTRAEGWYREELFARFRPIASYGAWDGADPLAPYLRDK